MKADRKTGWVLFCCRFAGSNRTRWGCHSFTAMALHANVLSLVELCKRFII